MKLPKKPHRHCSNPTKPISIQYSAALNPPKNNMSCHLHYRFSSPTSLREEYLSEPCVSDPKKFLELLSYAWTFSVEQELCTDSPQTLWHQQLELITQLWKHCLNLAGLTRLEQFSAFSLVCAELFCRLTTHPHAAVGIRTINLMCTAGWGSLITKPPMCCTPVRYVTYADICPPRTQCRLGALVE